MVGYETGKNKIEIGIGSGDVVVLDVKKEWYKW